MQLYQIKCVFRASVKRELDFILFTRMCLGLAAVQYVMNMIPQNMYSQKYFSYI